ncbi:hypothetical protein SFRURICE_008934, partial [Spodoptera frugiperda]
PKELTRDLWYDSRPIFQTIQTQPTFYTNLIGGLISGDWRAVSMNQMEIYVLMNLLCKYTIGVGRGRSAHALKSQTTTDGVRPELRITLQVTRALAQSRRRNGRNPIKKLRVVLAVLAHRLINGRFQHPAPPVVWCR